MTTPTSIGYAPQSHVASQPGGARDLLDQLKASLGHEAAAEPAGDIFARLRAGLAAGTFGGRPLTGDCPNALVTLLERLAWQGSMRRFAEAMPHFCDAFDETEMCNVLARLGYRMQVVEGYAHDVDTRLLPLLVVGHDGVMSVLVAREGAAGLLVGADGVERNVPLAGLSGRLLHFTHYSEMEQGGAESDRESFLGGIARRFRRPLMQMLALTLMIDLIALAGSFAVMAIYDTVIPAQALDTLYILAIGVLTASALEAGLRIAKAKAVGYVSGRLDYLISTRLFAKLLSLPLELTGTLPVGAQVSKLRQFDALREVFIGPFVRIALELPFIFIFLVALAFVAGWMALVPVALALVFGIAAMLILPSLRRQSATAARLTSERQTLLLDTFAQMRAIRAARCEDAWMGRLREVCGRAAIAQHRTAQISAFLQGLSAAAVPVSGVAAIALGSLSVMGGTMTVGALVAGMMLIWRILAPLQQALLTAVRFTEIAQSCTQLDQFMAIRGEANQVQDLPFRQSVRGTMRFQDVSFRYPRATEPALSGINLTIPPGSCVAVMGPSGSGKSTLMRLSLALFHPQGGAVLVDGVNLRQFDPTLLRSAIGYVPQLATLFHGTLAQNILLAAPDATMAEIERICADVGILDTIRDLPEGFDTRVTDLGKEQLSAGFRQGFALAQALLRRPTMIALDDPAQYLDPQMDQAFTRVLQNLRGQCTVLMATHRPSHAALADRILVLDRGRVAAFDTPDVVLPKLQRMNAHAI